MVLYNYNLLPMYVRTRNMSTMECSQVGVERNFRGFPGHWRVSHTRGNVNNPLGLIRAVFATHELFTALTSSAEFRSV